MKENIFGFKSFLICDFLKKKLKEFCFFEFLKIGVSKKDFSKEGSKGKYLWIFENWGPKPMRFAYVSHIRWESDSRSSVNLAEQRKHFFLKHWLIFSSFFSKIWQSFKAFSNIGVFRIGWIFYPTSLGFLSFLFS